MSTPEIPDPQSMEAPRLRGSASLRRYIYYSTMLGIFSARVGLQAPVHILLFYGIMLVNFVLLFALVDYARIPAWIPCLFLYLMVSGGLGIANGTDTVGLVSKEILGIMASALYFYYFFRFIENDVQGAFHTYCRIAFWFAILGMPLWFLDCIEAGKFLRLEGLASEPAQMCLILLPAYYWYAYQYVFHRRNLREAAVLTLAIACSASSLGYVSVAFGVLLLLSGRLKHFFALPIVLGGLFYAAYTFSTDFRERLNDAMFATATSDLSQSNLSTYALLSNAYVTEQVFHESPIMGNGLGSHPISHERYLGTIPGVRAFLNNSAEDINADDGASFAFRVLSELGLVGLAGVLIFLVYFHVGDGVYGAISNGVLVYFFFKLMRNGLYFEPEQFFFVLVYILNYRKFKYEARARVVDPSPEPPGLPLHLQQS